MQSYAKATIARRNQDNTLLNASTLSPMRKSPRDLTTEHPSPKPEAAIIERAILALNDGQTHYVDVPGIGPLREQLSAYLVEMGLSGCTSDNVLVTAGVQESRFVSIQIVGTEFGAIALPAVVHPGVKQAIGVRRLNTQELRVDAGTGFLPTIAGIRSALESGCKLLYLESPVRLTGAVFDSAGVREIARLIEHYDAAAIWDQGLSPWIEQGRYSSLGAQSGISERVVVLGEAWPGMGLESWLIGYVGANTNWLEAMRSQKQIMSICTSTASQFAALEAGNHYVQVHEGQIEQLSKTRQTATEIAARLGATPVAGATVNLMALHFTDSENTRTKLQDAGFDVLNGTTFGAPDILRLSVTLDDTLTNALKALI